jgi:methylated-DNA-[protein]-cysteine S-methyltransferase
MGVAMTTLDAPSTPETTGRAHACKLMASPIGTLKLVGSDAGLSGVLWERDAPGRTRLNATPPGDDHPVLTETATQLGEYFAGLRTRFTVPLDFVGTPFQQAVWAAMCRIPFGQTRSYGELAREIGHPKAVRAVGAANRHNPIAILGPCHRVIGKSGTLTGYAGGLEAKSFLLRLESVRLFD